MRSLALLALVACLVGCGAAVSTMPAPLRDRPAAAIGRADLAVRCGVLFDGDTATPWRDMLVVIRQGSIAEVTPFLTAPPGVPFLDLSSSTVLPGFIDMHTHLVDAPDDSRDLRVQLTRTDEEAHARAMEHAATTLAAGFTTVRDLGTYRAFTDRWLRDEIFAGRAIGPRMQVAGMYLTIPGGGGDLQLPGVPLSSVPARFRAGVARGPKAFAQKAEAAIAGGADLLKAIASGAVLAYGSVPGAPEMTARELLAVGEVARRHGLRWAAHAHGARSIVDAIRAGATTIEHASFLDDEGIQLLRARGVRLSMDVYDGDYLVVESRKQGLPEEFVRKTIATTDAQRRAFRRSYLAGVRHVFGTDAGVYPHGDNARQFRVMVTCGMRPIDAIRAATSYAAEALGWAGQVGVVRAGAFGDLVAVDGDPIADIGRLEHVHTVIQGGVIRRAPTTGR